jgi:hypothetical protein
MSKVDIPQTIIPHVVFIHEVPLQDGSGGRLCFDPPLRSELDLKVDPSYGENYRLHRLDPPVRGSVLVNLLAGIPEDDIRNRLAHFLTMRFKGRWYTQQPQWPLSGWRLVYADGSQDSAENPPYSERALFLMESEKCFGVKSDWKYLGQGLRYNLIALAAKLSHRDLNDFKGLGFTTLTRYVKDLILESPPKVQGTLHEYLSNLYVYLDPSVYVLDGFAGDGKWKNVDTEILKGLKDLAALPIFEYYRGWGESVADSETDTAPESSSFGFIGAALLGAVGLGSLLMGSKTGGKAIEQRVPKPSVEQEEEERGTAHSEAKGSS